MKQMGIKSALCAAVIALGASYVHAQEVEVDRDATIERPVERDARAGQNANAAGATVAGPVNQITSQLSAIGITDPNLATKLAHAQMAGQGADVQKVLAALSEKRSDRAALLTVLSKTDAQDIGSVAKRLTTSGGAPANVTQFLDIHGSEIYYDQSAASKELHVIMDPINQDLEKAPNAAAAKDVFETEYARNAIGELGEDRFRGLLGQRQCVDADQCEICSKFTRPDVTQDLQARYGVLAN